MSTYETKTMSADAASIQSTSTLSSLKSLLHRNQAGAVAKAAKDEQAKKEKAARKAAALKERRLNTEATFAYMSTMR